MSLRLRRVPCLATLALVSGLGAAAPADASASRVAAKPPPEVARMLKQVDARRIEHSIRTLASFGTRHTLSSQDDPKRGIGAARDWLLREFQDAAAGSDRRMTVEL